MKLIYLKRRGGKTTKAVKESIRTGALLIVATSLLKETLIKEYSLSNHKVATFNELRQGLTSYRGISYGTNFEIIIDDADLFLQTLVPFGKLSGITMSRPFTKSDCKKFGLSLDMVGRT